MMKWWWGMKKGRKREACDLGDSHRIQTCNLLIRSQMLYSVELASLVLFCECKVNAKF